MRWIPLALAATLSAAADWPQWRGPERDGQSGFAAPKSWPEKPKQRWKVTVGEGHSSPIAAGGKVFVHARQGEEEVVLALEPATGKTLWRAAYPAPYSMHPAARAHGKGVKSTPVASGGRLYTLGIGGVLSCFDAASGKLAWRKDFSGQFRQTSPAFGMALSPAVDRGLLILHAGGRDQGALMALDAATGAAKWSWTGDGPGYASPVDTELVGVRQVVTETQKNIVGVSAATGELLWQIPFTTPYEQNCVTPLRYKDLLILSGLDQGVMAVRVSNAGGKWKADEVWRNRNVSLYMNSPVLAGDVLIGFSHRNKGQFFGLDPRNGTALWQSKGREGDNAALVAAGPLLLSLTDDATLRVAQAAAKAFEPFRTYTVADSPTWAHPLPLERAIIVKDATTLARWDFE